MKRGAFKVPREPAWLVVSGKEREDWRDFIVIVLHKNDRHHFSLAHNGQRFCRDIALRVFCEQFPAVAEEVTAWAEVVA